MSFVRDVIVESLRALGTNLPEDRLAHVEQAAISGLRPKYEGATVRFYIPKAGTFERAKRAREIRAQYAAGVSVVALASRYGISRRQVERIVAVRATSSD